jgi:pilus assembly protein CpaB
MRAKSIILLVLALSCGLVAALGINQVLASRRGAPGVPGETLTVYVVAADIGIGDPLTAQNVKLEPWPKDKVPFGALTDKDDVEGRRSRTRLVTGELLLEGKLLGKGENGTGAPDLIPQGFRVVPVKIDALTTPDLLGPGDFVDLLVNLEASKTGVPSTITVTFLSRVKVFAVDQRYTPNESGEESAAATRQISLLVKPEEAERIALASNLGNIRMIMRHPNDETVLEHNFGVDLNSLLHGGASRNPGQNGSGVNPLLALLNGVNDLNDKKPEPEPEAAKPEEELPKEETWVVRIWDGNVPREVELKKLNGTWTLGGDAAGNNEPSADPVPSDVPPESQSEPADEPSSEDASN